MGRFSPFTRIFSGLERTRKELAGKIGEVLRPGRAIDPAALDELEEALITADLGPSIAAEIVDAVRRKTRGSSAGELPALVREELRRLLPGAAAPEETAAGPALKVVLVVGVNGGGKTTTVGKLAARWQSSGRPVVV